VNLIVRLAGQQRTLSELQLHEIAESMWQVVKAK
jgi:hypothetical protein